MPIKQILFGLYIMGSLTACSTKNVQQSTDAKKQQFEQAFAKQCVEKEVRHSINKDVDRLRFAKPCACIATRIVKNISLREMDKFVLEHKVTHSLTMSFDRAAYFCIQGVGQPKSRFSVGRKP